MVDALRKKIRGNRLSGLIPETALCVVKEHEVLSCRQTVKKTTWEVNVHNSTLVSYYQTKREAVQPAEQDAVDTGCQHLHYA